MSNSSTYDGIGGTWARRCILGLITRECLESWIGVYCIGFVRSIAQHSVLQYHTIKLNRILSLYRFRFMFHHTSRITSGLVHFLPGLLGLSKAFLTSTLGCKSSSMLSRVTSSGEEASIFFSIVKPASASASCCADLEDAAYNIRSLILEPEGQV